MVHLAWLLSLMLIARAAADASSADYSLHAHVAEDSEGFDELSFTILQVPDMHYTGTPSYPCRGPPHNPCSESNMTDFINSLLDHAKPDLVVYTGDQVEDTEVAHTTAEVKLAIDAYSAPAIARRIPWAMVFGNHDEGRTCTRQEMMAHIQSRPFAYSQPGPPGLGGVGNYELAVSNVRGQSMLRMYFLDTGFGGAISAAQQSYMRQLAAAHKPEQASAVMFYHIPIPEYTLTAADTLQHGHQGEPVSKGPQSGLLDTLVQMGDVKATFVGHDHYNDYCVPRKGIQLCFGGGVGYGAAYGSPALPRSARVIHWKRNSTDETITTWKQAEGDYAQNKYLLFHRSLYHT